MRPRRISAALAVLALGLLLATAGVAAASSSSHGSDQDHKGAAVDGSWTSSSENPPVTQPPVTEPAVTEPPVTEPPDTQGPASGHPSDGANGSANGSSGGSTHPHDDGTPAPQPDSGGGVTAAGTPPAGVPQTPVQAPAAAVNGPAPAAAAAAPTVSPTEVAAAVTPDGAAATGTGTDGAGNRATAADTSAETPAETPAATRLPPVADPYSLAGLPQLRSLGDVAASVSDGPSTARELLATPAGRSVAVLVGLVLAVLLFLSVHRRLDRSDPKLTAAQSGPDVARFR